MMSARTGRMHARNTHIQLKGGDMTQHTRPAFVAVPTSELLAELDKLWPSVATGMMSKTSPSAIYADTQPMALVWRDAEICGVTASMAYTVDTVTPDGWSLLQIVWTESDINGAPNFHTYDITYDHPRGVSSIGEAWALVMQSIVGQHEAHAEYAAADDTRAADEDYLIWAWATAFDFWMRR